MLFDVKKDPYETKNLAEEKPDICKEAVYRLQNWHDEMMETMPYPVAEDPLWRVKLEGGPYHCRGFLKRYCEHLKKTGREQFIPKYKEEHPREFK